MLLAIISTIIESICDILFKKALSISDIKPTAFQFFGEMFSIPIMLGIVIYGFDFRLFKDPFIVVGFILMTILFIIYNNLGQQLYKEEKLSTLLPYFKLNNFVIVILGFVFLKDTSLTSFIICVIAIILTSIFSIDTKHKELPKNFSKILLHETVKAIELFVEIWMIKKITTIEYVFLYQVIYMIFTFFVLIYIKEFNEIKKFRGEVVKYRGLSYTIGYLGYMIDIFLLKELGIVITTLLGFFGSSLSIAFAYFFLKEEPEKKEILLGIIVIILAGVGYYYK